MAKTSTNQKNEIPPRKKGGIKSAFQDLLDKLIAYWEIMAIYIEKNVHTFIRNAIFSSVWIFSSLFFIFIAFCYLSFAIYLSIQKYLLDGDPILTSLLTSGVFLLLAVGLIEMVLKAKK